MKQLDPVVKLSEDDDDNETTYKPLDFDKILKFEIGEWGLYQILAGISIGLVSAFSSYVTMNFMFAASIPEHR